MKKRWIAARGWRLGFWPLMFGVTLLIRQGVSAVQVEQWYSRGMYLAIRQVQGAISASFSFPLIYVVLAAIVLLWGWSVLKSWRVPQTWGRWLAMGLGHFFSFLCALAFFFLWLWGFQYKRVPVETTMALEVNPVPLAQLEEDFHQQTAVLVRLRSLLHADTASLDTLPFSFDALEKKLEKAQAVVLQAWDYPVVGQVKGRSLFPKGILLHFSSSGVYLPWTGEGHVDAGLHALQVPFVLAHELAHGQGFADEGICNFWGYLTCMASDDPFIQYAGQFAYWRYVASSYRKYCPENYAQAWREMPEGVRNDLIAIYENMERYPDWMPRLRDAAYDQFLRVQGIEEGIQSYSRIVMLVHAYRRRIAGRPVLD